MPVKGGPRPRDASYAAGRKGNPVGEECWKGPGAGAGVSFALVDGGWRARPR
jgi:hypothetical protein